MMTGEDDTNQMFVNNGLKRRQPPTEADNQEFIELLLERYKESDGRILASSADAHPFVSALSMLRIYIGIVIAVVLVEPFFVLISEDPLTVQMVLFVFDVIAIGLVLFQAYVARIEEIHIRIRSSGYSQSTQLQMPLAISVILLLCVLFIRLVAAMTAMRLKQLPTEALVISAAFCVALLILALIVSYKHQNLYILNDR